MKVKQWRIATDADGTWIVFAPTRYFARLNFRHYVGHAQILSIGVLRIDRSAPTHILRDLDAALARRDLIADNGMPVAWKVQ